MGTFGELKDLGTKEIRFNQTKCIDNELRNDSDSNLKIKNARDGMCYIFSLAYIQDFITAKPITAFVRGRNRYADFALIGGTHSTSGYSRTGGGTNTDEPASVAVRAAVDANLLYSESHKALKEHSITSDELARRLAGYFGLTVLPRPEGTLGLKQLRSVVDAMARQDKAQIWELGLYMKEGAHAVVLGRRTGNYYFFDPNVGGYRVELKNIRKFVNRWEELCIEKLGADWEIELISVTAFDVSKHPADTAWTKAVDSTVSDTMLENL